jgi:prepilin-type N-terminal cleavage/methylation domain-containing protein
MRTQRAFTLMEVVVVVVILAALAVIAVPRLPLEALRRRKVEVVAEKIVTDLRLTRRLAISNAATNNEGFELDMIGDAPYEAYEIANRKTKVVVASHLIDPAVTCTGDREFKFRPLGNLEHPDLRCLTVSADGKSRTLTVIPATGMVKCE